MSLGYVVFRLGLKNIENSDDWFDSNGRLKYKERFLFDTLLDAGELKNAELMAVFNLRSDAVEFCQGAGTDADIGEYVEVGY